MGRIVSVAAECPGCFSESWTGAKKGSGDAEHLQDRGCGRPGQRDYGWKGPAFNCSLGTVACLAGTQKAGRTRFSDSNICPTRGMPRSPLTSATNSQRPPFPLPTFPQYPLHFLSVILAPVWLTWGGDRKTHTLHVRSLHTQSVLGVIQPQPESIAPPPTGSCPSFTAVAQVQSLERRHHSFTEVRQKTTTTKLQKSLRRWKWARWIFLRSDDTRC